MKKTKTGIMGISPLAAQVEDGECAHLLYSNPKTAKPRCLGLALACGSDQLTTRECGVFIFAQAQKSGSRPSCYYEAKE